MDGSECECLGADASMVGAVALSSNLAHIDNHSAKTNIILTAYRAVQRACGEEGLRAGAWAWEGEEGGGESYVGDTDPSLYDSPCVLSLHDDAVLRVETEGRVLMEVGVGSVGVACTVPGDLCRLLVLAAPPLAHAFPALPAHPHALVLALTVTSVHTHQHILDRITHINPNIRETRPRAPTTPPPKPLRASQRKSSNNNNHNHGEPKQQETQQKEKEDETKKQKESLKKEQQETKEVTKEDQPPPLVCKKQKEALKKEEENLDEPRLREDTYGPTLSPSSPIKVSGHYPLRGQLSGSSRAQDCHSGIYDELGPLRAVQPSEDDDPNKTHNTQQY
ncbi:hypothetical protein Pcinc_035748 [Petrolisthes cinctipes]|uniref:Uncharacterized protein n=1 Tax=Petrolisthes cinctipes TaxID=88211 RepID=A0AAE1BZ86_PETCI|nr:hypothetical protein Pcinc_035748 [Petrolisthes cinctipes]